MAAVIRLARPPREFRPDSDRTEDGAASATQRIERLEPLRPVGAVRAICPVHRPECRALYHVSLS